MRTSVKILALAMLCLGAGRSEAQTINAQLAADRCNPISVSGVVFDVDVTCANSFPGGDDTMHNMVASPGDGLGSAQTYYDFYMGGTTSKAETSNPTLVGYPGHKVTYLSFDGGDYLSHTVLAAPTAFLGNMHREDVTVTWSFVTAFHFVHSGVTTQALMGTYSSSTTSHPGARILISTSDVVQLARNTGDSVNTSNTKSTGITLVDGTDYVLAMTFNSSTLAYKASINGLTFSDTGTATALTSVTNSHAATDIFSLASANQSNRLVSGSFMRAASLYNATLSDANLATISAVYEARHNKDYTP